MRLVFPLGLCRPNSISPRTDLYAGEAGRVSDDGSLRSRVAELTRSASRHVAARRPEMVGRCYGRRR